MKTVRVTSVGSQLKGATRKEFVKGASLPDRILFNEEFKGYLDRQDGDRVAYEKLMGHPPPDIDDPQMTFTGRKKLDKELLNSLVGKKSYEPDPKPTATKKRRKK